MYIVFEGPDGSGKSTLAKQYVEDLNADGKKNAVFICEPTNEFSPIAFRDILKGTKLDNRTQLLLFYANRIHISKAIRDFEDRGITVVSDRSHISSMVYQTGLLDLDLMNRLDKFTDYPRPNHVIILNRPNTEDKIPDDEIEKNVNASTIRKLYLSMNKVLETYYGPQHKSYSFEHSVAIHNITNITLDKAYDDILRLEI